jgi:hypothetical protein|tara:strand:+ start:1579 stop:1785 length:207 start_codon:yes stop_codon:yes gene_type:complete
MSESIEELQLGVIDLKVQANRLTDNIHSFYHIHDLEVGGWLTVCKNELLRGMAIVNEWLNLLMDEVNE